MRELEGACLNGVSCSSNGNTAVLALFKRLKKKASSRYDDVFRIRAETIGLIHICMGSPVLGNWSISNSR